MKWGNHGIHGIHGKKKTKDLRKKGERGTREDVSPLGSIRGMLAPGFWPVA